VITDAEAYPTFNAKSITKLVIQASKQIGTRRGVGLRRVLTENLSIEARVFSKMIKERMTARRRTDTP
jgi:hypothetical protein